MKAYDKLLELVNNESVLNHQFSGYTLESITSLLEIYQNPHNQIKTVHIAGSNGKGSVAYYLNSIMIEAGYKTGLFTSPHLIKINERICIDSKHISDAALETYSDELFSILNKKTNIKPTFFDALTLFAFRYFYDNKVDCAIIETGLGGKLDSTNLVIPECAIITDISLEHTQVLGNNIRDITREKAGIIKKNSIVFTSNTSLEVIEELTNAASKNSARLYKFEYDFTGKDICLMDKGDYKFDYHTNILSSKHVLPGIRTNSPGRFQVKNSSLAISAALLLREKRFNISDKDITRGIETTVIPGRMHVLLDNPMLIYDPAHNPVALEAVLEAFRLKYKSKKLIVITSFMKDKEYIKMFNIILNQVEKMIYFDMEDPRSVSSDELNVKKSKDIVYSVDNTTKLLQNIKSLINSNVIFLFTGTFRLFEIAQNIKTSFHNNQD